MSIDTLACQQSLNDGLGGDTSMVFAWNPQGIIALHAVIANKNIFDSGGNGVAQVKCTCNIGWWHTDHKAITCRTWTWLEVATLFPEAIPLGFDCLRLIC